MNKLKKNKKYFVIFLFILIIFQLFLLSFLYKRKNDKILNNKNIVNQEINKNVLGKEKNKLNDKKKIENNLQVFFNPNWHKLLVKKYGNGYIIDFIYGIGYTDKYGNNHLYIEKSKQLERLKVLEKIKKEIIKKCYKKMNLYDLGGITDIKKWINNLFTYFGNKLFLEKEKIDILQNYIDKYCHLYDLQSVKYIKKWIPFFYFKLDDKFKCDLWNLYCISDKNYKIKNNIIKLYFITIPLIKNTQGKEGKAYFIIKLKQ